ncbi:MAG: glycerate kinase [Haloferacaceae archaeon]
MFDHDPTTPAAETALACLRAGIEAATPERVVAESCSLDGDSLRVDGASYDLAAFDRVLVLGTGKPGAAVASALEDLLGDRIDGGAVVVPADVADPDTGPVERLPGDHPVPSERGVQSAERARQLAESADDQTLVLAVLAGGGSSLLAAPAEGVSLADLRETTDRLLAAGADIGSINAVRRHLSAVKGGGLSRAAAPATVVGLVFSDVVGDDPAVVASGPTAPDPTTFGDALDALDRHGVEAPAAVRDRLERGARGEVEETAEPGDQAFARTTNHVVASGYTALAAAREAARDRGYDTTILAAGVTGEAREAAHTHAAVARQTTETGDPLAPPAVVLAGGECTVTVRGDGTGGPNLEFALSAALDLRDAGLGARVAVAAVDTDGLDGSTDAAGALVDGTTVGDERTARAALAENDALTRLDDLGAALRSGATDTNVNDLRVAVVEADEGA